jgi:hypothetical protein
METIRGLFCRGKKLTPGEVHFAKKVGVLLKAA